MSEISVIIPLYTPRKNIKKSIESLARQTFRDFEIVLAPVGEPSSAVKKLAQNYDNVVIAAGVANNATASLLSAYRASRGSYLAFVDAGSVVSRDWLRTLHARVVAKGADIAIGRYLYGRGKDRHYYNLDPLRRDVDLRGAEIMDCFMRQRGCWHAYAELANKLYSKKLWEESYGDLLGIAEQIKTAGAAEAAASAALWSRAAGIVTAVCGADYYPLEEPSAPAGKTEAGETDELIGFMRRQLAGKSLEEEYAADLAVWGREENGFLYSVSTKTDRHTSGRYESAVNMICSEEIEVVSFDAFDTLLLRPFWQPKDLFALLNDEFNRLCENSAYVNFFEVRVDAERACRKSLSAERSDDDDVTLDDIYARIAADYGFDAAALERIKMQETALEKKFCYARQTGKQLFDLARQQGKKVIVCSDIYLPRAAMADILHNCGYDCDEIFLSSESKRSKSTGRMFAYVSSQLGVPASKILHIGDNAESDVKRARRAGWNAFWLPRSIDVFKNSFKELYAGNYFNKLLDNHGDHALSYVWDVYLGLRCAYATVANKLFDYPFAPINPASDLDCDPYFIGYFTVGQYLFAVSDWIVRNTAAAGKEKVHFAARDGYLPMLAYNMFRRYDGKLPPADYLYVSRKSTMLADVRRPTDIYSLSVKMNMSSNTAAKLVKLFRPFMLPRYDGWGDRDFAALLGLGEDVYRRAKFPSRGDYYKILSLLAQTLDYGKLCEFNGELKEYFAGIIGPNDILFDLGYTGRQEAALSSLLGYPVDGLYIHANTEMLDARERAKGFETRLFYEYRPAITGVVREHVFMKRSPSAVGYSSAGGRIGPLFEEYVTNCAAESVTAVLQKAALAFVEDMLGAFGDYLPALAFRKDDLAYAFEYYLHYSRPFDRQLFGCVSFEDDIGIGKSKTALDSWNDDMELFRVKRPDEGAYRPPMRARLKKMVTAVLPKGSVRREKIKRIYYKLTGKTYVKPDFFAANGADPPQKRP